MPDFTAMASICGDPGLHVRTSEDEAYWCYRCPDGRLVCWPDQCGLLGNPDNPRFGAIAVQTVTLRDGVDPEVRALFDRLQPVGEEGLPDGAIHVRIEAGVDRHLNLRVAVLIRGLRFYEWCICCEDGREECGSPPRCGGPFAGLEQVVSQDFFIHLDGVDPTHFIPLLVGPILTVTRCEHPVLPDDEWRTNNDD